VFHCPTLSRFVHRYLCARITERHPQINIPTIVRLKPLSKQAELRLLNEMEDSQLLEEQPIQKKQVVRISAETPKMQHTDAQNKRIRSAEQPKMQHTHTQHKRIRSAGQTQISANKGKYRKMPPSSRSAPVSSSSSSSSPSSSSPSPSPPNVTTSIEATSTDYTAAEFLAEGLSDTQKHEDVDVEYARNMFRNIREDTESWFTPAFLVEKVHQFFSRFGFEGI